MSLPDTETAMDSSNNWLVPGTPNCISVGLINDQSNDNPEPISANVTDTNTGSGSSISNSLNQSCILHGNQPNDLHICLMNARSLINKFSMFCLFIL